MLPLPKSSVCQRGRRGLAAVFRGLSVMLLLAAGPASAVERVGVELGTIAGAGWQAEGVRVVFEPGAERASGRLAVRRLVLPGELGVVRDAELACGELRWSAVELACLDGRLDLDHPQWGEHSLAVELRRAPGGTRIEASTSLGGGHLEAAFEAGGDDWRLTARARGVAPGALPAGWRECLLPARANPAGWMARPG